MSLLDEVVKTEGLKWSDMFRKSEQIGAEANMMVGQSR